MQRRQPQPLLVIHQQRSRVTDCPPEPGGVLKTRVLSRTTLCCCFCELFCKMKKTVDGWDGAEGMHSSRRASCAPAWRRLMCTVPAQSSHVRLHHPSIRLVL